MATLAGDGIEAELGLGAEDTTDFLEANVTEPGAEVGVLRLVEVLCQLILLVAQLGGKGIDIDLTVLVLSLVAPLPESRFYLCFFLFRQNNRSLLGFWLVLRQRLLFILFFTYPFLPPRISSLGVM